MSVVIVALGFLVVGIAIVVVELRRATPCPPQWSRRNQIAVLGALFALMMVAISPSLGLVDHRGLPIERPEEPWRDSGAGCSSDGGGSEWLALVVVGVYLGARGGPALVAIAAVLFSRTDPQRRPDGRFALRVAAASAAVVGALVSARVLVGGAQPDDFETYGAIVPRGAAAWRVNWTLARLGEPQAIDRGETISDELEDHPGSHMGLAHGPYSTALSGTQAWVAEAPVLFFRDRTTGRIMGSYVQSRSPSRIPKERRPHFATWPDIRRFDDDHLVLVGAATDGGTLTVKVEASTLDVVQATYADTWLLVRPPFWPWLVGLVLAVGGAILGGRSCRRSYAPGRMLAAWILLEGTAVWMYGYLTAFGLSG